MPERKVCSVLSLLFYLLWLLNFVSTSALSDNQTIESPHVRVTLVSENQEFYSGEQWLAIVFKLDPEWHVYWRNPGDSGAPPKFKWDLPIGVLIGDVQWPVPKRIPIAHLMNYGYEHEAALLVPLHVDPSYAEKTLKIQLVAEWLVCKEDCIPGDGQFEMNLKRGADSFGQESSVFKDYRKSIPLSIEHESIPFSVNDKSLNIAIPQSLSHENIIFLPYQNGIIQNAASQQVSGNILTLQREKERVVPQKIAGLLIAKNALAVELVQHAPPVEPKKNLSELLVYIFFAFVGGLILNLMPCVLPVIGLKLFSLAENISLNRTTRINRGMLFALGVLSSLWFLWSILITTRSFGLSFGWGFQLQEPSFVSFLVLVLTLLAFNLFGFFEIGTSLQNTFGGLKGRTENVEAYLSGLLTTIVSTPCTAPFMGTSIAFAFTADPFSSFLIFTSLGAGLSAPYLLCCMAPNLIAFFPRPGNWMNVLKQLLAFPLLLTVVWLSWVFALQRGVEGLVTLLTALVILSFGVWILSITSLPNSTTVKRRVGLLFFVFIFFIAFLYSVSSEQQLASPSGPKQVDHYGLDWIPFSESKVAELRSKNKMVFVDYTAAWCITCQVNKKLIFSSEAVRKIIREREIALVRADWTTKDKEIESSIKSFGKAGVPLNILYRPGQEPEIFPTVLTSNMILEAIQK